MLSPKADGKMAKAGLIKSHKATKVSAGHYIYRGIRIKRNRDTPAGYWNAWSTGLLAAGEPRFRAGSLTEIKNDIDRYLVEALNKEKDQ